MSRRSQIHTCIDKNASFACFVQGFFTLYVSVAVLVNWVEEMSTFSSIFSKLLVQINSGYLVQTRLLGIAKKWLQKGKGTFSDDVLAVNVVFLP